MNRERRTEIYSRLREKIPQPETELRYVDPFELLIAVILSAQATDISVNKATALLYPVANTPQGLLDLGVDRLKSYIKTIGLYNSKAENIIKTCRILLDRFLTNSKVAHGKPSLSQTTTNYPGEIGFLFYDNDIGCVIGIGHEPHGCGCLYEG